jgi:hypothetical protein
LRQIKDRRARSFSKSQPSSALTANVHLSVANAEETNNYRSPWGLNKKDAHRGKERPEMRAGNLGNPLIINSERIGKNSLWGTTKCSFYKYCSTKSNPFICLE